MTLHWLSPLALKAYKASSLSIDDVWGLSCHEASETNCQRWVSSIRKQAFSRFNKDVGFPIWANINGQTSLFWGCMWVYITGQIMLVGQTVQYRSWVKVGLVDFWVMSRAVWLGFPRFPRLCVCVWQGGWWTLCFPLTPQARSGRTVLLIVGIRD